MKTIIFLPILMCCMDMSTAQDRASAMPAPQILFAEAIPDLPLPVAMIRSKAKTNDRGHEFSDYVRVGTLLNAFTNRQVTNEHWDVAEGSTYTLHATLMKKPFVVIFEYMSDRGETAVHATLAGKPYPAQDLVDLVEIVRL